MREYQIFADSSCDLPESLLTEHDINLIPFYISFNEDEYYKDRVEITNDEFYHRMTAKDVSLTTALPSVQDYMNEFRPALKNGHDILCLCLTHAFSGSYQSALNAKHILEEQYPDSNIQIIDSIQATAGEGLVVLQAAYMKKDGLSLETAVNRINILKSTARIMFTVDTLEYLAKGRRIGKAASLAGDMLDIKPLIWLREGELIPYSKVRGRRKSLVSVYSMLKEHFRETGEKPEDYDYCIANATTEEDALYLQRCVEEYTGCRITYPIFQIGVTIGTYTGPGAIGICLVKKYDRF